MNNSIYSLPVFFTVKNEVEAGDGRFLQVTIDVLNTGLNVNKSYFTKEVVDENRLAQEIVIFSDKSSIQEELTRQQSHISQFISLISTNDNKPLGKKCDFIIQEMNREVNTIGSKANSLDISNCVIELKTQIEDVREQIQNIE